MEFSSKEKRVEIKAQHTIDGKFCDKECCAKPRTIVILSGKDNKERMEKFIAWLDKE